MQQPRPHRTISLQEFTNTFVLFGIATVIALFAAEVTMNLLFYRALYCLWAAIALSIPAICFWILSGESLKRRDYWLLFWSFGFIAFCIHLGYAYWGLGQWDIVELVLAGWWAVDLLLGWTTRSQARWIRWQRNAVNAFAVIWFAYVSLGYQGDEAVALLLGGALLVSVLLCLVDRTSWSPTQQDNQKLPA